MTGNFYPLLKWIILPPLAGFVLNGGIGKRFLGEKGGGWLGAAAILLAFIFSFLCFSDLLNLPAGHRLLRDTLFNWISAGSFSIDFALRFDPLSAVMALVVTGVSFLIHVYSIGYMRGDKGFNRYFSYLNLFVFFMLILVLADNPILMFVGWEGVGLCSYLLIGFWYEDEKNAAAGKKAFITNRVGDAGFLIGLMLLSYLLARQGVSGLDFETLALNINLLDGGTVLGFGAPTVIGLLLFFGATGKSAQFPLYIWLPDAMAGPTPVSALIHAATMVTAGVYMLARMSFLYALAPRALEVVLVTGVFTALLGAVIAALQSDIKKVLAYSTISQIGYMFMAAGTGAYAAGIFHLTTHAFFKALLFLAAGSVIHGMAGEQEMFRMGGLSKEMRFTFALTAVGWLAISGIPPLAGFYSKDLVLEHVYAHGVPVLWYAGLATAGLTAYYVTRLLALTFLGGKNSETHAHESPLLMTIPMAALAALALTGGWLGSKYLLAFLDPASARAEISPEAFRLTMISVITALAGVASGFFFAIPAISDALARRLSIAREVVYNKFYVDEIYAFAVIRPLKRLADKVCFGFLDAGLIDGLLVNGAARLTYRTGAVLRNLQTGNAQGYALTFTGGLILLLYWIM
ncbi:MAG: NADH-quinone oxidoreductase subunit L [Elusimicrobia bacterium GWA2_56_46]|nr:MAG: NADH-quinone oxidoreductase subunit L [Elusimicrobia bacterium GWA2_56_46]OGR55666.1 MAG: NADH-quinone oxidoreductase subunit L [Elusimicrobia bacterium GWC2_56_31]HBW23542.1 NADH-quinone oxidoreductase subunit L [Elusimicrobiota bacterium]